ncbi:MAG: Lrp/AsnC family transcriptional regulator [Lachnospiraceae bacterium]
MDTTDLKILNILQDNARTTLKEIGFQVGLTSPAVSERIHHLEEEGTILGYSAKINTLHLGQNVSAFVEVDVPPRQYDKFLQFCLDHSGIVEHHHIIGPYNSMLKISVHDSVELERLLYQIKTYGNSQTAVILSTYFTRKDISS